MLLIVGNIIFCFLAISSNAFKTGLKLPQSISSTRLNDGDIWKDKKGDVWTTRRKIVRTLASPLIRKRVNSPVLNEKVKNSFEKDAFIFSAVVVTISSLILRVGGRTALVSILGLDFITDLDIKSKLDSFVSTAQSVGNLKYMCTVDYLLFY